jgi:hypothetical protein
VPRTSETLLGEIFDLDEDIDTSAAITDGNLLVDQVCLDSDYSEELLTRIETYLAAHFLAIRDPRTSFETIGEIQDRFEGKTDMGLRFTRYGQQAILLDTAGNLAKLDNTQKTVKGRLSGNAKSITWLGTSCD